MGFVEVRRKVLRIVGIGFVIVVALYGLYIFVNEAFFVRGSVRGKVVDARTGEPVPDAIIMNSWSWVSSKIVLPYGTEVGRGKITQLTITDSNGEFRLKGVPKHWGRLMWQYLFGGASIGDSVHVYAHRYKWEIWNRAGKLSGKAGGRAIRRNHKGVEIRLEPVESRKEILEEFIDNFPREFPSRMVGPMYISCRDLRRIKKVFEEEKKWLINTSDELAEELALKQQELKNVKIVGVEEALQDDLEDVDSAIDVLNERARLCLW